MNARTILLILLAGLANGQLNFEGNPLTENTEYTAEESRFYERTARQEPDATNVTYAPEYSRNRQPLLSNTERTSYPIEAINLVNGNSSRLIKGQRSSVVEERPIARQIVTTGYNQAANNVDQAEVALNSFLNSKTPEESRLSLDQYLQSREYPQRGDVNQQSLTQTSLVNQQALFSPVNRHLTAQLAQQRQGAGLPVNQPVYNAPANPMGMPNMMSPIPNQQPYALGIQSRNDVFYPDWYHRVRKVRGKPFPYAQSRVGPGFYNGPPPSGPFKPKGPPVEVIYTKPPGFHNTPPISNPPLPYEDASAWFPEADHPPPAKDVYYSQLYAQSYDPYYYNYIAKTGKIKPHLYGKLGKHHEEEDGGIWSELYRGFKKHGLKNIMTPTFLLGMTLPVVTLMLSALVQKRSLARSDSRGFSKEDAIQEYLEQVQKAVECHERRRRRRDTTKGC